MADRKLFNDDYIAPMHREYIEAMKRKECESFHEAIRRMRSMDPWCTKDMLSRFNKECESFNDEQENTSRNPLLLLLED